MIRLRNLEKYYESGYGRSYVLRQIDLDIVEGDFVTIMGPSGAGKSTLLHILGMLDSAWEGEYWFDEEPVHKLKPKHRSELHKRTIGFVFQSYHLLDQMTVYENLEVGQGDHGAVQAAQRERHHDHPGHPLGAQRRVWQPRHPAPGRLADEGQRGERALGPGPLNLDQKGLRTDDFWIQRELPQLDPTEEGLDVGMAGLLEAGCQRDRQRTVFVEEDDLSIGRWLPIRAQQLGALESIPSRVFSYIDQSQRLPITQPAEDEKRGDLESDVEVNYRRAVLTGNRGHDWTSRSEQLGVMSSPDHAGDELGKKAGGLRRQEVSGTNRMSEGGGLHGR